MAGKPKKQQRRYLSYMLRLWRENANELAKGDTPLWRASLERPQGGEQLGFASLVDLFVFLEKETGSDSLGSERLDDCGYQPPESGEQLGR